MAIEIPVQYYTATWGLPAPNAQESEPVECRRWRYWNHAGMGIYIVAVANFMNGEPFQWAAYIGASLKGGLRENDGVQEVAETGCKVNEELGKFLFPDFAEHFEWRA